MNAVSSALTINEQAPAPAVIVSESAAIFQIIERAARDPNVDIDKMQRLMEMHERVQAGRAAAEFADAFAAMQPNLPIIPEKGKGHNNASYALWEDVNELIKPVLAEYGFGLSFKVKDSASGVEITAICKHRAGHSEETSKTFPLDTSGNKNPIQASGSTISYGKRYTASALLNLTSRNEDDDGKKGGGKPVDPVKSSASLKRDDIWKEMMLEINECGTVLRLGHLREAWSIKANKDNWPNAWKVAAGEEFQKAEAAIRKADEVADREALMGAG